MRKLSLAASLLFAQALFGQSPLTQVQDTITYPNGTHPSGTLVLSWTRGQDDSSPRKPIYPGSQTVQITNGVVNVSLFPTTVELPPGLCIKAVYNLAGVASTRYWSIPVSSVPVPLALVEGQNACPVPNGALIAPGQIVAGPASGATVLTSSPSGFVSWQPGGGSGGAPLFSSILSGVNNSNQTFTMANGIINTSGSGIIAANQLLTTPITALLGNSGKVVQGSGSYTVGDLGSFDSNGNLIDSTLVGANVIVNSGSYANPSWIASLSASKLTTGTLPCAQLQIGRAHV